MNDMRYYIAYGSNLNLRQMRMRCLGAKPIGSSVLCNYRLTFRGNGYAGVANIEPRVGSRVPVGIWTITEADERALDRYEGFPRLYHKCTVRVSLDGVNVVPALVYVMAPGHSWQRPSTSYLDTIRQGYKDFNLGSQRNLLYAARNPTAGTTQGRW